MKLSLIPGHESTSKVQFSWKTSTVERLQQYLNFYKANTSIDVPMKDVTEQMLLDFMNEDKAFQKFLKPNAPQAQAAAPSATAAGGQRASSFGASSAAAGQD